MDKEECKSQDGKWEGDKCYMPVYEKKKSKVKIESSGATRKSSIAFLFFSLIIDGIGYLSYAFPGFGEMIDIIWAPLSAFIVFFMYGNTFVALAQGFEEIMPFMDFIPTATLAWIYHFAKEKM